MAQLKPRISIGMPVFNGEKYIREALDSLLAQTYADFELIISDNGSTDETRAICEEYAARDSRIRYYRSNTNNGAAWNYNRLVELAHGEFFRWAAHDDVVAPTHLERCVAIFEAQPDVVLCYPKTMLIDENGALLREYEDRLNLQSDKAYVRYNDFHKVSTRMMNVAFGLIRMSALRETLLIGNYQSSDRNLIAELALRGTFYEVPEHLFFRREHAQMSVKANRPASERAVWFDPSNRGRVQFPNWRLFCEYVASVNRVPLRRADKALCYARMGQWIVYPGNVARIGVEILTAMVWPVYESINMRRAMQNELRRKSV